MALIPVRKTEIVIGKPLPWSVFDAQGTLLLNAGQIIVSERQVEVLCDKGMFREPAGGAARAASPVAVAPGGKGGGEGGKPAGHVVALDEIKLAPGDMLQIQPLTEGATDRYHVRVIGYNRPASIICTSPQMAGGLVFVRDGQPFLARCFIGKDACAFKTRVLKSNLSPYPYLHLAYPDAVQSMRIRKSVRVPVELITAIHVRGEGSATATGKIVDLSVTGARIHTATPFAAQEETVDLVFRIQLSDMEEYVRTPVRVRSVTEDPDPDTGVVNIVTGVEFHALESTHRLFIMNLIYQNVLKDSL